MSITINGGQQTAIIKHSILSEAINQNLLNSNEQKRPIETQYQNLNKAIYRRIFVAYFQSTAVGKFMNNIRSIYVIHLPPVQCLSNIMRSGLAEYNTNLRVLYLKLIVHVRRGEKGKLSIFNAYKGM